MMRAAHKVTLHELEGFSLVMLCSCQGIVRKLAVHLLKEIRNLFSILNIPKVCAPCKFKCQVLKHLIDISFQIRCEVFLFVTDIFFIPLKLPGTILQASLQESKKKIHVTPVYIPFT